jgi:hydroxyacylglutathione hydrolase
MAPEPLRYQCLVVGNLETNAYVLHTDGRGFVIDPGDEPQRIVDFLEAESIRLEAILLTHGHVDHSGGVGELIGRYPVPLLVHRGDAEMIDSFENREFARLLELPLSPPPSRTFEDGDVIGEGPLSLTVYHTPGHTPGSVVFLAGSLLFTGDTLFCGDVGRTDLPGGSWSQLQQSLEKLRTFSPELTVLPGHGEPSTLEREFELNPYF